MRDIKFAEGEFYHIYNRGVDKKIIFPEREDYKRFWEAMNVFNDASIIGSLGRKTRTEQSGRHGVSTHVGEPKIKLVEFVAYCLNPNHFHFILQPSMEKGIEKFMHKIGMGHSKYFNTKYKRSGALFQGSFKAVHIDSNEYLLHVSAYVNLNAHVHGYGHGISSRSSWDEYTSDSSGTVFCEKEIILEQFKNRDAYKKFAESSLEDTVRRRQLLIALEDEEIEEANLI